MQVHDAGDGDKLVTVSVQELANIAGLRPDDIRIDHVNWNDAADKVYILLTTSPDAVSRSGSLVDFEPIGVTGFGRSWKDH